MVPIVSIVTVYGVNCSKKVTKKFSLNYKEMSARIRIRRKRENEEEKSKESMHAKSRHSWTQINGEKLERIGGSREEKHGSTHAENKKNS
jgi:hypothetical protein